MQVIKEYNGPDLVFDAQQYGNESRFINDTWGFYPALLLDSIGSLAIPSQCVPDAVAVPCAVMQAADHSGRPTAAATWPGLKAGHTLR